MQPSTRSKSTRLESRFNPRISQVSPISSGFFASFHVSTIHKHFWYKYLSETALGTAYRGKKDTKTYKLLTPPFFTPDCRIGQALMVISVKFCAGVLGKRCAVCYVSVLRSVLRRTTFLQASRRHERRRRTLRLRSRLRVRHTLPNLSIATQVDV